MKILITLLNFLLQCVERALGIELTINGDAMTTLKRFPTNPDQDALMQKLSEVTGIFIKQDALVMVDVLGPRASQCDGFFASSDKNPQFNCDIIGMNAHANNAYWYSVLFHELAHATGTRSRLCRMGVAGMFSNPVIYAIEEVIAETVATRIMERMDLATDETRERSKKYIKAYEDVINRHGAIIDVIQLDQDFDRAETMVMQWLDGIELKAA